MRHWKQMMDKEYVGWWDIEGRDVTVTIASVKGGELRSPDGKKDKKPILFFEGTEKGFVCNSTNCATIEALYGTPDVEQWVGKAITLYVTTTNMGGKTVKCIRVRNVKPAGKKLPDAAE